MRLQHAVSLLIIESKFMLQYVKSRAISHDARHTLKGSMMIVKSTMPLGLEMRQSHASGGPVDERPLKETPFGSKH